MDATTQESDHMDNAAPIEGSYYTACLLARKRYYEEAKEILAIALKNGACTEAQALDLGARISVQQGNFLDAEAAWGKAQIEDPGNPKYAAAIAAIHRIQSPRGRVFRLMATSGVISGVIAILLLMLVNFTHTRRQHDEVGNRLSQLEQALKSVQANQAQILRDIDEKVASLESGAEQTRAKTILTMEQLPTAQQINMQFQQLSNANRIEIARVRTDLTRRMLLLQAQLSENMRPNSPLSAGNAGDPKK